MNSKEEEVLQSIIENRESQIKAKKQEIEKIEDIIKSLKNKQNKETILNERRLLTKTALTKKNKLEDIKSTLKIFDRHFSIKSDDLTEYDLQF
jgi:hypothetical protein